MAYFAHAMRTGLALVAALLLAACGRSESEEVAASAAPVRHVVATLSQRTAWTPGKCLCVGHFREDAVEDFPAGVLDSEFARHRWLKKWSVCESYYSRLKKMPGCEGGLTDFICSVSEKSDLPSGTMRVICHVNGQSEALQKAGYLQDEYDVARGGDGSYTVKPISLNASGKIHE